MNFSPTAPEEHCLIHVDTVQGVRSTGLEKFSN
jgi:hypothetical protein